MNPKPTLMLASVVLVGSLAVSAFLLLAQIYSLALESGLQEQVDEFKIQIANLQDEKANLQNKLSKIGPPKIFTRLGARDIRSSPYSHSQPWSGRIRLYVAGEVGNVGQGPAYNCKLHIVLYQGDIVANNTYVELGTINPGSFVQVAANVYYEGEALTNWTVIPETE